MIRTPCAFGTSLALLIALAALLPAPVLAEEPAQPAPAAAEAPKASPLEALAFWNWFAPKPQDEQAAAPAAAEGEQPKGNALESLAFWNWFAPKPQDTQAALAAEEQGKPSGGVVETLAFWNWLGKKPQPAEEAAGQAPAEPQPVEWLTIWKKFGIGQPLTLEEQIMRNPAPELISRAETRGEQKMREARMQNLNRRSILDDLNTILMRERPSRLSLQPTPY